MRSLGVTFFFGGVAAQTPLDSNCCFGDCGYSAECSASDLCNSSPEQCALCKGLWCRPTTTPPEDGAVAAPLTWPQFGVDNSKCVGGEEELRYRIQVSSQEVCQLEAVAANHNFYQYSTTGGANYCVTVPECSSPIIGTEWDWTIYSPLMWPQVGVDNSKCVGGHEELKHRIQVSSQAVCQMEAVAAGHSYYQYSTTGGANYCVTVANCSPHITGTKWDWTIHYLMVPTTTSRTTTTSPQQTQGSCCYGNDDNATCATVSVCPFNDYCGESEETCLGCQGVWCPGHGQTSPQQTLESDRCFCEPECWMWGCEEEKQAAVV